MPELPEVESTRRHLVPVLEGRRIVEAVLTRDRLARRNARPADVSDRLRGRRVGGVGRRGKFLLIEVEGNLTWVVHLGMSGRVRVVDPCVPLEAHAHFRVVAEGGTEIRLIDPRTFGLVAVFTPDELAADPVSALGPDALDDLPTTPELRERLEGRSAPIKAVLLDQRFLAGLGNIYADEVLFRAGVRPLRAGGRLRRKEVERMRAAIGEVLEDGIAWGGTSLDDLAYLLPDGRAGAYLERLMVYGRADQGCRVCGSAIRRVRVAARSSYFCPSCQR